MFGLMCVEILESRGNLIQFFFFFCSSFTDRYIHRGHTSFTKTDRHRGHTSFTETDRHRSHTSFTETDRHRGHTSFIETDTGATPPSLRQTHCLASISLPSFIFKNPFPPAQNQRQVHSFKPGIIDNLDIVLLLR